MTVLALVAMGVGTVATLLVVFLVWRDALRRGVPARTRPGGGASVSRRNVELDALDSLDATLDQSFPASDPPPFSTGIARPYPAEALR